MLLNIIKNLFITICFTVILFVSASSFYIVRSNYLSINATIEQLNCVPIANSNVYACDFTISYLINGNKIKNRLVTNSDKVYKQGDIIEIEYDTNNYLNISLKTEYKQIALISSVSATILLITSIIIYDGVGQNIIQKINNILSYVSFLS